MQILHAGPLASCRTLLRPRQSNHVSHPAMPTGTGRGRIEKQLADFANCASRAREAGYDGVEIIGSAGYLLSTFLVEKTNRATDRGAAVTKTACAFRVEVVRRIRAAVGEHFIVIFRIAAMDMLQGGMSWEEVVQLGQAIETGRRQYHQHPFHLARVRSADDFHPGAPRRLHRCDRPPGQELGIPTITSNRINMPEVAERCWRPGRRGPGVDGAADAGRCGLCDQGAGRARGRDQYLHRLQPGLPRPHLHRPRGQLPGKPAGLPRDSARIHPTDSPKRIAVVGAGPAGLGYATVAAQRGHSVTLFDAAAEIGGQFNLARRIPGKEEFRRPCATTAA